MLLDTCLAQHTCYLSVAVIEVNTQKNTEKSVLTVSLMFFPFLVISFLVWLWKGEMVETCRIKKVTEGHSWPFRGVNSVIIGSKSLLTVQQWSAIWFLNHSCHRCFWLNRTSCICPVSVWSDKEMERPSRCIAFYVCWMVQCSVLVECT